MKLTIEWRERADIPNERGFRVEIKTNDGTRKTRVVKGADGCHTLEGVPIRDVVAWRAQ